MAIELKLDLSKFLRDLEATADDIGDGARRGLEDVMDEWKRKSVDVAPLNKGTLIRGISGDSQNKGIHTEVDGEGINLEGEIISNAVESIGKWKRFNYAYYIHEVKGLPNPSTPGRIAKYLDQPAKENEDKWMRKIEKEIEKEVKRRGW